MRGAHHREVAGSGHRRTGVVGECGSLRRWCATVLIVTELHSSRNAVARERSHAGVGRRLEAWHAWVRVVVSKSVRHHTILALRVVSKWRSAQAMIGFCAAI